MGQLRLVGEDAAGALETLVPVDIVDLPVFKQRYALFTNERRRHPRRPDGLTPPPTTCSWSSTPACKDADIAHLHSTSAAAR
jgi:aminomethyltransferase